MDSTYTSNALDRELEIQFIAETFHKNEPIVSKPVNTAIDRVWIKDKIKPKTKKINGIIIKMEPLPKIYLKERFAVMEALRKTSGIVFESDYIESESDDENGGNEEDYEDIDDATNEELTFGTSKGLQRSTKNKLSINLAKKLKKRAIANRLGIAYQPNSNRMKGLKPTQKVKTLSWSEKFGRLLAAKKLLYLPLLFRKYKMGPKKTREELDIEIDLYMSEVKNAKLKLGYTQIKDTINGDLNNNGLQVVNSKEIYRGFGGPGYRKRPLKVEKEDKIPDKCELDMEIDEYMANKDKPKPITMNGILSNSEFISTASLDSDLDQYMASVKKKMNRQEVLVNGFN